MDTFAIVCGALYFLMTSLSLIFCFLCFFAKELDVYKTYSIIILCIFIFGTITIISNVELLLNNSCMCNREWISDQKIILRITRDSNGKYYKDYIPDNSEAPINKKN
jgi:hypothetical protein